jgi:hypothetical protein
MSKIVAEVIVETLQSAGVKRCYGVVGDTLNYVTDAMRRSTIEWVHVRHEEVGGFAAGAEAMLTGNLTACAGSCGPGSLHFINGLFQSHRNRAPVVLIASQVTNDEVGFDFPQEVDFKPIYQHCSVFCEEIRSPAQLPARPGHRGQPQTQRAPWQCGLRAAVVTVCRSAWSSVCESPPHRQRTIRSPCPRRTYRVVSCGLIGIENRSLLSSI